MCWAETLTLRRIWIACVDSYLITITIPTVECLAWLILEKHRPHKKTYRIVKINQDCDHVGYCSNVQRVCVKCIARIQKEWEKNNGKKLWFFLVTCCLLKRILSKLINHWQIFETFQGEGSKTGGSEAHRIKKIVFKVADAPGIIRLLMGLTLFLK